MTNEDDVCGTSTAAAAAALPTRRLFVLQSVMTFISQDLKTSTTRNGLSTLASKSTATNWRWRQRRLFVVVDFDISVDETCRCAIRPGMK